jgi:hypothetical protein
MASGHERTPFFRIELHSAGDREAVRSILEDLPEWFGRPESTEEYVKAADRLPNYFALSTSGDQLLEEFMDLWPDTPCLFMVKPLG